MPIDFPDKLRSTRADGLLVDAASIDGDVDKAQLHADTGIPSYVTGAVAYAQDTGRFSAAIAAIQAGNELPKPSIVFMVAPSGDDLPRGAIDINLMLNNESLLQLVNVVGENVKARDITPGMLLEGIIFGSQMTLVEPLPVRPQDYRIVFVIGRAGETDITAADVAGTSAAATTATSNVVEVADAVTASGLAPASARRVFIGVPADAPDPIGTVWDSTEYNAQHRRAVLLVGLNYEQYVPAPAIPFGGVAYKWFRSTANQLIVSDWLKISVPGGAY